MNLIELRNSYNSNKMTNYYINLSMLKDAKLSSYA